jgi:hypothetical protein
MMNADTFQSFAVILMDCVSNIAYTSASNMISSIIHITKEEEPTVISASLLDKQALYLGYTKWLINFNK